MELAYLDENHLVECWSEGDPTARMRCSDAFIFSGKADSLALVHMVLEPGGRASHPTPTAPRRSCWYWRGPSRRAWGTKAEP